VSTDREFEGSKIPLPRLSSRSASYPRPYFALAMAFNAFERSVAVATALISVARSPRSSSSCTAAIVVPPGVVT